MAKTEKKISVNAFEKAAEGHIQRETVTTWNGLDIRVKYLLPASEMVEFVADIVDTCTEGTGGYTPELFDFTVRNGVMLRYANLTRPQNIEKWYELLYATEVYSVVAIHISHQQLNDIISAAEKRIEMFCQNELSQVQGKMNELITMLTKTTQDTAAMFDGLTPTDMKNVVDAVGNGTLNPDRVTERYIKMARQEAQGGLNGEPEQAAAAGTVILPFSTPEAE